MAYLLNVESRDRQTLCRPKKASKVIYHYLDDGVTNLLVHEITILEFDP